nr:hypothetical protein Iba_contig4999CG0010 [Ipomoea batatas]GME14930.1 hypothetical protein Iba_scaffold15614CG0050 [Ipomoea batatas]
MRSWTSIATEDDPSALRADEVPSAFWADEVPSAFWADEVYDFSAPKFYDFAHGGDLAQLELEKRLALIKA